jgi:hypothetical protein
MENRAVQSKRRYVFALLIGTAVFVLVFLLSYYISYLEFQRVSTLQAQTAYEIFEDKLNYILFNENICSEKVFQEISTDLGFQGRIIDDLENKLGKNNENVLLRKKFYTLVELEHLEFINLLNEKCDFNINTILFFYSNEKSDLGKSEELGRLLGTVYARNQENLMIYSFDINLNSKLIENLRNLYEIDRSSVIIINQETKLVNPQDLFEIENYLN